MFTVLSLVTAVAPLLSSTVNSRSTEPLLTSTICFLLLTASPITTSRSKLFNWLKIFFLLCLFFRVETLFALTNELHLLNQQKSWAAKFKTNSNQPISLLKSKVISYVDSFGQHICDVDLKILNLTSDQRRVAILFIDLWVQQPIGLLCFMTSYQ